MLTTSPQCNFVTEISTVTRKFGNNALWDTHNHPLQVISRYLHYFLVTHWLVGDNVHHLHWERTCLSVFSVVSDWCQLIPVQNKTITPYFIPLSIQLTMYYLHQIWSCYHLSTGESEEVKQLKCRQIGTNLALEWQSLKADWPLSEYWLKKKLILSHLF